MKYSWNFSPIVFLFFDAMKCFCLTACPSMETLTSSLGVITSPSYPRNYGNNHRCGWKIIASRGYRVVLFIDDVDIEGGTNCPYDYIEFQNGVFYNGGVPPGRFCGTSNISKIFSNRETLIVRFVSDGSVTRRGFKARFLMISSGSCK